MRVGVIGDVHGHIAELVEMVATLEQHQVDRIVLLGDLVDRGPDAIGCLELARYGKFKARCGRYKAIELVSGNHEDGYVRAWRGIAKPGEYWPYEPASRTLLESLEPDMLQWLAQLPHFVQIEQLGLLLVHGGILPTMQKLEHLDERILRVRFLDQFGEPATRYARTDRIWASDYDGRFGLVVFGHESFAEPAHFEHALGLDGEGWNRLHAAVFTDEKRGDLGIKTLTVPYKKAERRLASPG